MAISHNINATKCGDNILRKIRGGDAAFKQVFSPSIIRTGDWDWPRPDYVCYDETLKATYALEFKPPFQPKREYLTGLGQSLSYLQKHTYSGLIVSQYADDNFHIADFIKDTLEAPEFFDVALSLFAYDNNSFEICIMRSIEKPRIANLSAKRHEEARTFWSWWRDISQYEVYDLLNLSFLYGDYSGDIYTEKIYPHFYKMVTSRLTRQWYGTPRNKSGSEASMKSEKQNCKIPLVQLDLWTRNECRLTSIGFELLQIGKLYGAGSENFLNRLAYLVLVNGRHLDIINMIGKFQQQNVIPSSSRDYLLLLDEFLTDCGCIGKRKPTAVTTGAKISYLRDEPKLWNKLGLLEERNRSTYFFPREGYRFNWERISNLLVSER